MQTTGMYPGTRYCKMYRYIQYQVQNRYYWVVSVDLVLVPVTGSIGTSTGTRTGMYRYQNWYLYWLWWYGYWFTGTAGTGKGTSTRWGRSTTATRYQVPGARYLGARYQHTYQQYVVLWSTTQRSNWLPYLSYQIQHTPLCYTNSYDTMTYQH